MYGTILVPLDGSRLAEAVLPYVEELAKKFGSHLIVVQSVSSAAQIAAMTTTGPDLEPGLAANAGSIEEIQQAEHAAAEEYLARTTASLQLSGIQTSSKILSGAASDQILEYSKSQRVDLIALSTHGRTGLGRVIFGSVADRVIRDSGVPVLVIRPSERHG